MVGELQTTAKADSEACSVAFILPLLEEFGAKPPPASHYLQLSVESFGPRKAQRTVASRGTISSGGESMSPRITSVPAENEPFIGVLDNGALLAVGRCHTMGAVRSWTAW